MCACVSVCVSMCAQVYDRRNEANASVWVSGGDGERDEDPQNDVLSLVNNLGGWECVTLVGEQVQGGQRLSAARCWSIFFFVVSSAGEVYMVA